MKWKMPLLFLLLTLWWSPAIVYSDTILTDEQATELNQTLDQLKTVLTEQATTINELQTQNEQLQSDSENKQQLLNEQDKEINELKTSYKKQRTSFMMHSILTSMLMAIAGFLVGLMFF